MPDTITEPKRRGKPAEFDDATLSAIDEISRRVVRDLAGSDLPALVDRYCQRVYRDRLDACDKHRVTDDAVAARAVIYEPIVKSVIRVILGKDGVTSTQPTEASDA